MKQGRKANNEGNATSNDKQGRAFLATTLWDEKLLRNVLFRLEYLVKPDQAGLFHFMFVIAGKESWEQLVVCLSIVWPQAIHTGTGEEQHGNCRQANSRWQLFIPEG